MPSTEQIVNDIKAILNQIEADTSATAQRAGQIKTDTDAIKSDVESLITVTQDGFANVSQGIATLVDRENESIRLLEINDEQNRVAICWLEILADLACRQLRRLDQQVELQTSIDRSTTNMRDIVQLVHSREALEVQREAELASRIEECCPPETPEPEPCYTPCEGREAKPYKRKVGDFKPLAAPKKQDKPG
jgi:hypothetical protein